MRYLLDFFNIHINNKILKINNKLNARQCEKTKIYEQRPNNEQIRRFKRL